MMRCLVCGLVPRRRRARCCWRWVPGCRQRPRIVVAGESGALKIELRRLWRAGCLGCPGAGDDGHGPLFTLASWMTGGELSSRVHRSQKGRLMAGDGEKKMKKVKKLEEGLLFTIAARLEVFLGILGCGLSAVKGTQQSCWRCSCRPKRRPGLQLMSPHSSVTAWSVAARSSSQLDDHIGPHWSPAGPARAQRTPPDPCLG